MKVVERLGRRKQEARAGLELARQKPLAAPRPPEAGAPAAEARQRFGRLLGLLALPGLDPATLAAGAEEATLAAAQPPEDNFAVRLGAIAAGLARGGADKLTFLPSPALLPLGPWMAEQILLRTGGVTPVSGEPQGRKDAYGLDRLFVSLALAGEAHDMTSLAEAGHPVVQWTLESPSELFGALVRWEIASATMAALLEVAPPGSAAAPFNAEAPLADSAAPPAVAEPSLRARGLALFADPVHAQVLRKAAGTLGAQSAASPASWIASHLALAEDCIVLLPRFAPTPHLQAELRRVQGAVRDATRLACTSAPAPGLLLELTAGGGAAPRLPPGALRLHAEDGDAQNLIQALHAAVQLISR